MEQDEMGANQKVKVNKYLFIFTLTPKRLYIFFFLEKEPFPLEYNG